MRRLHANPCSTGLFVLFLLLAGLTLQGCSNQSESPASPSGTQSTPAPTTGSVEGRIVGQKSQKPLVDQVLVLCQLTAEPQCTLRAALKATTTSEGTFVIKEVPAGHYTIVYAKSSEKALSQLKDGVMIDPTAGPVYVSAGTVVDMGGDGRLANVRGAVKKGGLTFEFRKGNLLMVEVTAGGVAKSEVSAWGQ